MEQINRYAAALAENLNLGLIGAISLGIALVFALAVYVGLGLISNRLNKESHWRMFLQVVRAPLALLVLCNSLFENLTLVVPDQFNKWLAGVDTLQALLIILVLLWIALRYIRRIEVVLDARAARDGAVELPLIREKVDRGTIQIIFKIFRALSYAAVVLMALQAFGLSIAGLLAFGGVGGIVVGFAARDIISNMFNGLRIFWSRPFVIGDWIKCPSANIEGVVEDIGWQVTQIRTFDKRPLYVPNAILGASVIENPQRMTNRRIYQYFGLRYEDIGKMPAVLKAVRAMLAEHPEVDQQQACMVNLDKFGDFSVDFFVYCLTTTTNWVHYHHVKEDILLKIADIVASNGADFAFPTRTINLASSPEKINSEDLISDS